MDAELLKALVVVAVLGVVLVGIVIKAGFWCGTFPPDNGWSSRQLQRMDQGKSPWTFRCWLTYWSDRKRDEERARLNR